MWDSACPTCFMSREQNTTISMMDKENMPSPSKIYDLSMYENIVPIGPVCNSPSHCQHNVIRRPLEDHDSNSQDSGYSASFMETKFTSYASPNRGSFLSFGSASLDPMEDAFLEDMSEIEPLDKPLPKDFSKLIEGPLSKAQQFQPLKDTGIRPLFGRSCSLYNPSTTVNKVTPNSSRVRSCLFKEENRPFKRPEPPSENENIVKRSRMFDECDDDDDEENQSVPDFKQQRPILQRAFSATEESIKSAVQRSADSNDLIGDFTKSFCLPLTVGRHRDLKSITPSTLAALMRGDYNHSVASFKVIDCRYPYEFIGGHINGAINLYTQEQCLELLEQNQVAEQQPHQRHILVFHCEFSSERGPNLYRFLRKQDRTKNIQDYPALNYPEIYLLEGGYKNFFQNYSGMCIPIAYKEMLHPEHEHDLRHFRQKSKTWNIDSRQRTQHNRIKRFSRLDV